MQVGFALAAHLQQTKQAHCVCVKEWEKVILEESKIISSQLKRIVMERKQVQKVIQAKRHSYKD